MITWSDTKLEEAVACMYRLFLIYVDKTPRAMTAPLAAGLYVHSGCKKFNDANEERPNFKSSDSYAGRRVGSWKRFVIPAGAYGGQKIQKYFDEELYVIAETAIRPSSKNFYEMFAGRDKPIAVEKRFNVRIGDFLLRGSFDVIDDKLTYLDYKTGKHEPKDGELKNDYQFTIYSAVLPMIIAHDDSIRDRSNLTEAQLKTLREDPLRLMEDVVGKYVHLRSGKTFDVKRTKSDVVEMLNTIESIALRAEQGDFAHSRRYHCTYCSVREKCDKDRSDGRILKPKDLAGGNGYMLFPPRPELKVYTDVPRNTCVLDDSKPLKRRKRAAVNDYPLFEGLS